MIAQSQIESEGRHIHDDFAWIYHYFPHKAIYSACCLTNSFDMKGNNLVGAEQAVLTGADISQVAITASGNVVRT